MNDLYLQRCPHRYEYQQNGTDLRWSGPLKRWLVLDPALVAEALKISAFGVADYDVSPLEDRFSVDLSLTKRVNDTLPLAIEGAAHKARRTAMAKAITQKTGAAMSAFTNRFDPTLTGLAAQAGPAQFCLIDALFRPAFRAAIAALAGFNRLGDGDVENLPLHFVSGTSLRQRLEIEAIYGQIAAINGADPSIPETAAQLGIVLLGINTLMGAVTASVIMRLNQNAGRPMSQIDWGDQIPVTSLPVIERIALQDTSLGGKDMPKGTRLRLFLESAGISAQNEFTGSSLYFASGAHKCLGITISQQIWRHVSQQLGAIDQIWNLDETELRAHDTIFNFYEKAIVTRHG